MTERRDIISRIENWARWSTEKDAPPPASQTGAICKRMERELGPPLPPTERRTINEQDAMLIERAWRRLLPRQKDLLRWYYIRHASRGFICRYLNIKHFPVSVFDIELAKAAMAVEAMAGQIEAAAEWQDNNDRRLG